MSSKNKIRDDMPSDIPGSYQASSLGFSVKGYLKKNQSVLRWLETVSSTFQDLGFDGSL